MKEQSIVEQWDYLKELVTRPPSVNSRSVMLFGEILGGGSLNGHPGCDQNGLLQHACEKVLLS